MCGTPRRQTGMKAFLILATSALLLGSMSCRSTSYKLKETVGIEKRDVLTSKVTGARDSQAAAAEQFDSALEQFQSVVDINGGDLEKKYKKLDSEYKKSVSRADAVSKRINEVERVSKDLFKEWKNELKQYSDPQLKAASREQMEETQKQFNVMLSSMRSAEAKMAPVLSAFSDQVLFLKHNLNSRAIASIQGEATKISSQIEDLIGDMNKSIAEADKFIQGMQS